MVSERAWPHMITQNPAGRQKVVKSSKNCQFDYLRLSIWRLLTCRVFSRHLTSFWQVFWQVFDEFVKQGVTVIIWQVFDKFLTTSFWQIFDDVVFLGRQKLVVFVTGEMTSLPRQKFVNLTTFWQVFWTQIFVWVKYYCSKMYVPVLLAVSFSILTVWKTLNSIFTAMDDPLCF